jgi:restriction endonuclease Mrr
VEFIGFMVVVGVITAIVMAAKEETPANVSSPPRQSAVSSRFLPSPSSPPARIGAPPARAPDSARRSPVATAPQPSLRRALREGLPSMSPGQFERMVAALFEARGFQAQHVGRTGDHGVDVLLTKDRHRYAVQAKRYCEVNRVGEKELREFYGSLDHFDVGEGYFVTTSGFTKAARIWARGKRRLHLVDREKLLRWAGEDLPEQLRFPQPRAARQITLGI